MRYSYRFDNLIEAMRRATATGRKRMLASHRKLVRRGKHLPSIPDGYRVVAGRLMRKEASWDCASLGD
jgi:hypothetical protein